MGHPPLSRARIAKRRLQASAVWSLRGVSVAAWPRCNTWNQTIDFIIIRQMGRGFTPRRAGADPLLDRGPQAHPRPGQWDNNAGRHRPACDAVDREAAVVADLGKIGKKPSQHLAPHKFLDDDESERVADERRRAQTIEIEEVQAPLRALRPCE